MMNLKMLSNSSTTWSRKENVKINDTGAVSVIHKREDKTDAGGESHCVAHVARSSLLSGFYEP